MPLTTFTVRSPKISAAPGEPVMFVPSRIILSPSLSLSLLSTRLTRYQVDDMRYSPRKKMAPVGVN